MRIALDTNVLVYAEGIDDLQRRTTAKGVLAQLPRELLVVSVQVLGELFNVMTRRNVPRELARARVAYWRESLFIHETSCELMDAALDLAASHKLNVWDAVILAAAAEARCDLLLSEDFQQGFAWRGVIVVNPFAVASHKRLASLLKS